MRISDWSSDVCSSDLAYVSTEAIGDAEGGLIGGLMYVGAVAGAGAIVASGGTLAAIIAATTVAGGAGGFVGSILAKWIGRASWRERVCQFVEISVVSVS